MLHLFKHFIDSFLLRIMFFKLNDIGLFCLETVTFPRLDRGNEILSLVSQTSSRCETISISLLMAFILVISFFLILNLSIQILIGLDRFLKMTNFSLVVPIVSINYFNLPHINCRELSSFFRRKLIPSSETKIAIVAPVVNR